jgi:hypothetical protein
MTVSNGQLVNADVTNAAFMSRKENTDTIGAVGLLKPTGSGDLILDVQQTLNNIIESTGMVDQDTTSNNFESNNFITDGALKDAIEDLDAALETHDTATTGVHGVSGSIVGTSDTQNLSNKTFTNKTTFGAEIVGAAADISTAGPDVTIAAPAVLVNNLTGALTSLAGITATTGVQPLILVNKTGFELQVSDESSAATAANRILTGTGNDLAFANDASLWLVYDLTSSRWRVVGGSGGGGSSRYISSLIDVGIENTIAISNTALDQVIYVQGDLSLPGSLSPTVPFAVVSGSIPDTCRVTLVGMSDEYSVSIPGYATAAIIGWDIVLGRGDTVTYQWVNSIGRWVILSTSV